MKALMMAFFYFMASMTCSWSLMQECCSGKVHPRVCVENHHSHRADKENSKHHRHSQTNKTCCSQLITPLVDSFRLLQKSFLTDFQVWIRNFHQGCFEWQKYFSIFYRGPPFSIRGRPLYIVLFFIHAPPHP